MDKIIIPFNDNDISDVDGEGIVYDLSWDSLLPTVSQFVRLRPDEVIDGYIASADTLRVKISRKKGRKIKA